MKLEELLPIEIMGFTIWGEARGEPIEGQIAVANVIANRADSNPIKYKTFKDVCLEPLQFSCWNQNDPNREKILNLIADFDKSMTTNKALKQAMFIATGAAQGNWIDNTKGAKNYITTALFKSDKRPHWAKTPIKPIEIGNHTFFSV